MPRDPYEVQVGDRVAYFDEKGRPRNALVTAVWPDMADDGPPGLNLVTVSMDEEREDSYGRQIERPTSVVHVQEQPAPGRYWEMPA